MDSLFNEKVLIKSQHRFKSDHHNVYTEEINKIALSSNGDKRIQTADEITTYPYVMKLNDNIRMKCLEKDLSCLELKYKSLEKNQESVEKRLIIARSHELQEESRKRKKEETDQIIARSRKLVEESRRRNENTDQVIARSQKLREESITCREETDQIINRSRKHSEKFIRSLVDQRSNLAILL